MWRENPKALALYWVVMCREWRNRGFQDNLHHEAVRAFDTIEGILTYPWWMSEEKFYRAHRSNLLRKNFAHYSQFGWDDPINLPYWWPDAVYVPNRAKKA
jgi:hypothetical protein